KDGGEFAQFTGATITPRAVVNAVREALAYARDHQAAWSDKDAP
ncbi:MAG: FMN-binding protein, partial [Pseudomonadales bacterium]|nr:FMN-binding protein [Pseudomonadales bacterium]